MQNLPSSSPPFKAGNSSRREDLSSYVALGLVMRKVRRLQRRGAAEIQAGKVVNYSGSGR